MLCLRVGNGCCAHKIVALLVIKMSNGSNSVSAGFPEGKRNGDRSLGMNFYLFIFKLSCFIKRCALIKIFFSFSKVAAGKSCGPAKNEQT